ncbi:HNH endonuclease [Bradyrhizobium neotropicale]|uniref:HNH endonuclease n=1 Tax=Bradyrhizobium neotropicale TaxID=1497615 RepID=UPI001AD720F4|nr:HNH endonuclease [Bradyrhizobium neotropicale]MBO4227940.1 hypothetical protein [Bradyrhizobium neotropicale]
MRRVTKRLEPEVLKLNCEEWSAIYLADKQNPTKKYRYRHPEIKAALKQETADKCVYCESKIGHNTPGDVEHMTPSSVDASLHFVWSNLTIACTECNRRKNDYFDAQKPFLNPYVDDVEGRLIHLGPLVCWSPGDELAEMTVRILELSEMKREALIARKVEKIEQLNNAVARLRSCNELMRELMAIAIEKMKAVDAEYSGMIRSISATYCI